MGESLKSVQKSSLVLTIYYAAVAAALIVFGTPLFQVLSFEYATLVALFGSLPAMWFSARYVQAHQEKPIITVLKRVWLALIPPVVVPIVVSLILVESCDLLYGLGYYAHIVLPSTMSASLYGALSGIRSRSKRSRIMLTLGIWLGTFLLSLLPGYISQQIYTHGWQYGYFPGFIWDDYIELGLRYNFAVFGYMLVAACILFLITSRDERKRLQSLKKDPPLRYLFAELLFAALTIEAILGGFTFFGFLSHSWIEEKLWKTTRAGAITIHHSPNLGQEFQIILRADAERSLAEVKQLYPSIDTTMEIDVYLYPSSEELHRFVGTRRASIAKPWLGTLHLAEENISSLKHELVHLFLKPYGSFPFYASWSTGLTEGAAVAAEDDYDGLRSADTLASWALAMGYAKSIQPFMQFAGFASTASSVSYILSGSFAKYLLASYGAEKLLQAYHTRDFASTYGKQLATLDTEWQRTRVQHLQMSAADSTLAQFYFDRSSVINQKCLRRTGRLIHAALRAFEMFEYQTAAELYEQAFHEDSTRIDAFRGMIFSLVKQKQFDKALCILDTARIMKTPAGIVLLRALHGDLHYLARADRRTMIGLYDSAIAFAANDIRYIGAVGMRMVLEDSSFNVHRYLLFRYGLDPRERKIPQALYERPWESPMPDSVRVGYALLRALDNESRGEYSAVVHEWTSLAIYLSADSLSPRVRKAYNNTSRKVQRWEHYIFK